MMPSPHGLMKSPTPFGALASLVVAQLIALGIAIALDAANPLYSTMAGVAGVGLVRIWGGWLLLAGLALGIAYRRHRRLAMPTRGLFVTGNLAGSSFALVAIAYAIHFQGVNTATAMYLPAALVCFYIASEGASPWARDLRKPLPLS